MPTLPWDLPILAGAAGLAVAAAALAAVWPHRPTAEEWLRFRSMRRVSSAATRPGRGWARAGRVLGIPGRYLQRHLPISARVTLSGLLARAGIGAPPELVVSYAILLTVGLTVATVTLVLAEQLPPGLVFMALVAGPLAVGGRLMQIASRRRRVIEDQLPILVDLMALEQGGGGVGARTAIELVVNRVEGEAALLLRECLTASATAGTPPLDRQLETVSDQLGIPALAALAAVVRIQREEGVSTASPLGQVARGLRDRQRDELMARGRRALVAMLLPVALCILLPFVIIILYPALARLSTAFS